MSTTTSHKTEAERFWEKVDKGPPDVCWNWTAALCGKGYGTFRLTGGRIVGAHRWAIGAVDSPLWVRHTCDNPRCVNPAHLKLGTPVDNSGDMTSRGRQARGEANGGGQKLTQGDVQRIRELLKQGQRQVDIASTFGITQPLVSQIKLNKIWSHI